MFSIAAVHSQANGLIKTDAEPPSASNSALSAFSVASHASSVECCAFAYFVDLSVSPAIGSCWFLSPLMKHHLVRAKGHPLFRPLCKPQLSNAGSPYRLSDGTDIPITK
jgi:hypothetical protein